MTENLPALRPEPNDPLKQRIARVRERAKEFTRDPGKKFAKEVVDVLNQLEVAYDAGRLHTKSTADMAKEREALQDEIKYLLKKVNAAIRLLSMGDDD